jgi:pimeloyl-ACP methyl ester carboxylesterase
MTVDRSNERTWRRLPPARPPCRIVHLQCGARTMANLFRIADSVGKHRASAIFLHGLGGDAYRTWGGPDAKSCWLGWLAEDIKGLTVWSVGYEAPISRWRGSAMHLTDRATNILARLLAEPALREGSLILIGHSLGGLVIKQLLRTADIEARHRQDAANLVERVEKVAFLGTPHIGSGWANWGDRLRIMVRPSAATICLVRNDPNLRDLNLWYRDWANAQNIAHLVLTETKGLRILGMIVQPDSSDPGLAGARPLPIDGNHWTLCKPKDKTSDIYIQVAAFIERRFERPRTPGEEKLDALSEGQKILLQQNSAMIALLQREKGIPRTALVGHLVRLGARDDIADEEIPKFLERFASEFPAIQSSCGGSPTMIPRFWPFEERQPTFSTPATSTVPRHRPAPTQLPHSGFQIRPRCGSRALRFRTRISLSVRARQRALLPGSGVRRQYSACGDYRPLASRGEQHVTPPIGARVGSDPEQSRPRAVAAGRA